jgi:hypothetical protein
MADFLNLDQLNQINKKLSKYSRANNEEKVDFLHAHDLTDSIFLLRFMEI